ncbi:polysaccharide deacetylase family protein [Clostridium gasigenes]|uniref:polysaccharide deacetylase family protein n=1 Tax=Clostridium gasigenes TaxID=94869 RepID=UPI0014383AF9|nr:polysaccharide deacetylase family protein [Clostridium gasigenes]MBU3131297.1 polysaccharide deacetylase family protein [Clostridium gasigenes]NKF08102.1 polysaccharide deacetylase family protein [Clostridium gasigenes]QSW18543.1 polysaccharide deacetylase family protein [Clostridium gasigenes]
MKGLIKIIIFIIVIVIVFIGIFMKSTSKNSTYANEKETQAEKDKNTKEDNIKDQENEANKEAMKIAEINKEAMNKKEKIKYVNLTPGEVYIPILMYHSISDSDSKNNLLIPVAQFTAEMSWLKKEGFTPMLMGEVISALKSGKVPKRPVAITFDDGYADNYTAGYKALIDNNMKATFFIITDTTDVDSSYMSSVMLKEMASKGMGIENHTSKHMELNKLSRADKVNIIKAGKDSLKAKCGVDSKYLCYPVGRYDDETIQVAKELGLEGAVTTEGGLANIKNGEFALKRIRMSPMKLENFKAIFESFMTNN